MEFAYDVGCVCVWVGVCVCGGGGGGASVSGCSLSTALTRQQGSRSWMSHVDVSDRSIMMSGMQPYSVTYVVIVE